MSEKNKALVRRYIEEIWNQGKLSSVDELVGENYGHYSSQLPPVQGPEGLKEMVSGFVRLFLTAVSRSRRRSAKGIPW